MKRSKRVLSLILMLVMLVSALTVGASASYVPLSQSYSDYYELSLSGYTEEQLAAFPVKDFLSKLTDSSGNSTPVTADKIAWVRGYSDNYTVSDAESGTIDLRFYDQVRFEIYMIAGSGNMLDFDGNTRSRVDVIKAHLFKNMSLLWADSNDQKQACQYQTLHVYDYDYPMQYQIEFFPEPENAKGYYVQAELTEAADAMKMYEGTYDTVAAAEASGKEITVTAAENAYVFAVDKGWSEVCVITEKGGVKKLENVEFYIDVRESNYGVKFYDSDGQEVYTYRYWSKNADGSTTPKYKLNVTGKTADAEYAVKLQYTKPTGESGSLSDIRSAYVKGSSEDIKEKLFGDDGYTANYSGNGLTFVITDAYGETTIPVILEDANASTEDPAETPAYSDGDPYFQAKSAKVDTGYIDSYVMPPKADSLYSSSDNCYQTILMIPKNGAELTMSALKPIFYVGSGVEAYARSVGETAAVKQVSGQSVVDFSANPVQYTAKNAAGSTIKNYWATFEQQQSDAKLFVNGPSFDALQTEPVEDKDKREVLLNNTDDYHDIFFANLGTQALGSLTVSLDEEAQKTLKLDDFWTVGGDGNEQLNAFNKTYSVTSASKIRLRLKDEPENLETNEISGVLTISSAAGTKYIYLTGSVMPEIVTDNVPNGVKYVPYSVMVQTNNHVDSNKVTFSMASGSLPDGISLNASTGEIYGVPTKVGSYSFSVKASFSTAGLEDSIKDYTIEILENTDNNVDAASDDPILDRVSYMGDENDDWNGQFRDQVFRVDHEYAEFVKFFIDGDLLRDGSDYVSEEGSTKITILRKTFERYGNGTHTIAAEFRDKSSNTMTKAAQNYTANVKTNVKPGSSTAKPIESPNKPAAKPTTPSQNTGRFIDVNEPDWFYDNVMWAAEEGYMVGVSANRFAPNQNTTQAMVVTVLARIAKVDLTRYADVSQNKWYTSAANWAEALDMIDLDTFEPNAPIRRGDLAVMLLKYFDGIKVSYDVPTEKEKAVFFDASEMTPEEEHAFQCCYKAGIFLGNGKNDMQPNGFTTRAQLAALIERIAGHVEANGK